MKRKTHFYEPIDRTPGRLAGNSRRWGDAPQEVKNAVIDMIVQEATNNGLSQRDIAHLLAIAEHESGFNPDAANNSTTASGIGQFLDKTWEIYGIGSPFDAEANIKALIKEYIDIKTKVEKLGLSEEYIYGSTGIPVGTDRVSHRRTVSRSCSSQSF